MSSRRGAGRLNSRAKGALSALEAAQKGGRAKTFKLNKEEDVYDVVGEEDYGKIVHKRREEYGDFVVDDDGLGYEDDGEEEDWRVAQYESDEEYVVDRDDAEGQTERKKDSGRAERGGNTGDAKQKGDASSAGTSAANKPTGDRGRLSRMFQGAAAASAAAAAAKTGTKRKAAPVEDSDAVLDDILGNLGGSDVPGGGSDTAVNLGGGKVDVGGIVERGERRRPLLKRAVPAGLSARDRHASALRKLQSSFALQRASLPTVKREVRDTPMAVGDPDVEHENDGYVAMKVEDDDDMAEDTRGRPTTTGVQRHVSFASSPQKHKHEQHDDEDEAVPQHQQHAKKKVGYKIREESVHVPSGVWQSFCDDGEEKEDGDDTKGMTEEARAAAAAETLANDPGLPCDDDGSLPFFFMDASEEPGMPGTVCLFGKVPVGKGMSSCCAIVSKLERCVFAVPSPGIFDDEEDEELVQLEEEADSGPEAKMKLIRALHARCGALKTELRALLTERGVSSFRIAPVRREYAFENEAIPRRAQWVLKIRYDAALPMLPSNLTGENFVALLGTQTSCIENLLIKRRIMGPSWLALRGAKRVEPTDQISWCRLEVNVEGKKGICQPSTPQQQARDPPPLVVAALNIKTHVDPKRNVAEIATASVMYMHGVRMDSSMAPNEWNNVNVLRHFSVVRRLDGVAFPPGFQDDVARRNASPDGKRNGGLVISTQSSERSLLTFLLAKLQLIDADVIVGHNVCAFDLDVLMHRLQAQKVPNWSRIGRLRRARMPNLSGGGNVFGGGASPGVLLATAGRLICDTYLSSKELLHEVSYSLSALAQSQLKHTRTQIAVNEIAGCYNSAKTLMELVGFAETDAWLSLSLMFKLSSLPLSRQLTNLSGSLWNRTLQGGRAQRTEYVLLHEFHSRKFMVPDKLGFKERERIAREEEAMMDDGGQRGDVHGDGDDGAGGTRGSGKKKKKKSGPTYAGGLVLEPKKGLYDKYILLLDFNSLYPSIIREYNICFTTVERPEDEGVPNLPTNTAEPAVLPTILRRLIERRQQVKALIKTEKNPQKKQQLTIRQQAIKLTANSIYGCLGFANSRFFARPIAQLVTAQGRDILQSTVDIVEQTLGFEIVYGDTDSVMVNTNSDDLAKVKAIGNAIKKEVNKRYRLLELEMDGVFKTMLLLKKKKYAAMKVEMLPDGTAGTVLETKGLDIVRRDWCPLSKDAGNFVLNRVMSGESKEDVVESIHAELRAIKERLEIGDVLLEKFIITKQLTKSPNEYPDARNQPHVQVALRRLAAGKRDGTAAGETVPYIICLDTANEGSEAKSIAERAFHPDELKENSALTPDLKYYLGQQVHPVVSRLCSPIEGTTAAHLADCLGLDPSRFATKTSSDARDDAMLGGSLEDEARFADCSPLKLTCPKCNESWEFVGTRSIADGSTDGFKALCCPKEGCGAQITPGALANQVRNATWSIMASYYDGLVSCDEETCEVETRNICARGVGGHALPGSCCPNFPKCAGHVSSAISESQVYTQLVHYSRLLDTTRFAVNTDTRMRLAPVKQSIHLAEKTMNMICSKSAYRWINLSGLFAK